MENAVREKSAPVAIARRRLAMRHVHHRANARAECPARLAIIRSARSRLGKLVRPTRSASRGRVTRAPNSAQGRWTARAVWQVRNAPSAESVSAGPALVGRNLQA